MSTKNNSTIYSKISLAASVLCLAVFAYSFSVLPDSIKVGEDNLLPMYFSGMIGFVLALLAGIFAIVSFSNNEPSGWIKWAAAIISALILIFVLGTAIFANLMDSSR